MLMHLQLAAIYHRADIYRLLLQHGLRPGLTSSLFLGALISFSRKRSETDQIDIFRCLLLEDELSHGLNSFSEIFLYHVGVAVGTIEWLWTNAGNAFVGTDLVIFRSFLLQIFVNRYCRSGMATDTEETYGALANRIVRLVDAEMRHQLMSGEIRLIKSIFYALNTSMESQHIGSNLIALLKALGLDFRAFIETELANLQDGMLNSGLWGNGPGKKVIFKRQPDGRWTLSWVWILNPHEHGYLVASEFVSLGADSEDYWVEWPFYTAGDYVWWDEWYSGGEKYDRRRVRREATKARRERARTGQKIPKSKMPGTWNW
ncbi:hypothetical protein FB567DRAFT_339792 [Paraphoma chrysanthemicola]|uniref:Uncharacterized protein n=1 Tax=Paraphoma chrysanthemicola TaxID=798071 RepID=A0A8K0R807_9PLEO|nr:hypothetical protein FB567DRAFT_339792 [Paraphoma chrysanthemicola]